MRPKVSTAMGRCPLINLSRPIPPPSPRRGSARHFLNVLRHETLEIIRRAAAGRWRRLGNPSRPCQRHHRRSQSRPADPKPPPACARRYGRECRCRRPPRSRPPWSRHGSAIPALRPVSVIRKAKPSRLPNRPMVKPPPSQKPRHCSTCGVCCRRGAALYPGYARLAWRSVPPSSPAWYKVGKSAVIPAGDLR